jgi:hypothetical protein
MVYGNEQQELAPAVAEALCLRFFTKLRFFFANFFKLCRLLNREEKIF